MILKRENPVVIFANVTLILLELASKGKDKHLICPSCMKYISE